MRELGKQQGQQKARQEIARKMLEFGEPIEKIAYITGLSIDEIPNLV